MNSFGENNIDGFVLAGGASSRMGEDKSALKLGGKTFIERAVSALTAVSKHERIFLVGDASENKSGKTKTLPDLFSAEFKREKRPRAAIIGLHTALSHAKTEWAAILACDLPFASGELFERLITAGEIYKNEFDAVVPLQPDTRPQPLCALYRRKNCLPQIEEILRGDDWSLQKLLRVIKTRFVRFEELNDLSRAEYLFFNVNMPEEFRTVAEIDLSRNE